MHFRTKTSMQSNGARRDRLLRQFRSIRTIARRLKASTRMLAPALLAVKAVVAVCCTYQMVRSMQQHQPTASRLICKHQTTSQTRKISSTSQFNRAKEVRRTHELCVLFIVCVHIGE